MSDYQIKINEYIDKIIEKKYDKSLCQILIFSEKNKIDIRRSNIDPDKPFHTASIGKMFTATIVGMLADKKMLDIDDKVSKYLSKVHLEGLFVFDGIDYKNDITIRDLLGHTSGVADYFESNVKAGSKFVDMILINPDKKWTPIDLLDFARKNQQPFSAPGEFHYSDTGYVLLGLMIEEVTGKTLSSVLEEMIFRPLEMRDSYLMFYKDSQKEITPIWFNGVEISKLNMLSCDWAGGGVVSTLEDLLKFQKGYWSGMIVSSSYMSEMSEIKNKFRSGMHYGLGMMELRFEEFFFLLRGLPKPKGHSGILSTFLFYDQINDLHFILNMGSNKRMPDGIKVFIQVESILKRMKSKT